MVNTTFVFYCLYKNHYFFLFDWHLFVFVPLVPLSKDGTSNPTLRSNTALENYHAKIEERYVYKKDKYTRMYVKFRGFNQDNEVANGKCWVVFCNTALEATGGYFQVVISKLKLVQRR